MLQNSQENTCAKVSCLIKLQASNNVFYRTTPNNFFWNADIAKTKQKKIDCLGCREVDLMLIASAKFSEREKSMSPSRFYGHLPDY